MPAGAKGDGTGDFEAVGESHYHVDGGLVEQVIGADVVNERLLRGIIRILSIFMGGSILRKRLKAHHSNVQGCSMPECCMALRSNDRVFSGFRSS